VRDCDQLNWAGLWHSATSLGEAGRFTTEDAEGTVFRRRKKQRARRWPCPLVCGSEMQS
jgi:hypothetical protein